MLTIRPKIENPNRKGDGQEIFFYPRYRGQMPPSKQQTISFLALPPEIRNHIYELAFSEPQTVNADYAPLNWHFKQHALTLTCRQIQAEALPVLFGMLSWGIVLSRKATDSPSLSPLMQAWMARNAQETSYISRLELHADMADRSPFHWKLVITHEGANIFIAVEPLVYSRELRGQFDLIRAIKQTLLSLLKANGTGYVGLAELDAIRAVMQRHGCLRVSDAVGQKYIEEGKEESVAARTRSRRDIAARERENQSLHCVK
ncbi:hypothetical protein BDV97DRAFT_401184 [Delphinella strobiligena]|nr:hypothetical protein BDV97DRAFT_401184 [Delphinella strobiligena]